MKRAWVKPTPFGDLIGSLHCRALFLSVLLEMGLCRLLTLSSRMKLVGSRGMCVVRGFFVLSALMVFSRFRVMLGCVGVML